MLLREILKRIVRGHEFPLIARQLCQLRPRPFLQRVELRLILRRIGGKNRRIRRAGLAQGLAHDRRRLAHIAEAVPPVRILIRRMPVTLVPRLRLHFQRSETVAHLDQRALRAGALLELPDVAFHVLRGKQDDVRLAHRFQVRGLRLVFVGIDARLHMRRHRHAVAADLLRDLREDRGEARNPHFRLRENGERQGQ